MSSPGNVSVDSQPKERKLTTVEALREALREEMRRDERVILLGEDIGVEGGFGGAGGLSGSGSTTATRFPSEGRMDVSLSGRRQSWEDSGFLPEPDARRERSRSPFCAKP